MCDYVSVQLVKMAKIKNVDNYEKLSEAAFNRHFFYLTNIFCFLSAFGAMMGYCQLVNDSMKEFLKNFISENSQIEKYAVYTTIGMIILFVAPFAFLRNLSSLSLVSILNLVTFSIVAVVVIATGIRISDGNFDKNKKDFEFNGFISAFGTLSYAFVCHDNTFPVFAGLKNGTQKRWDKVVHITVLSLTLIYWIFPSFCYFFIPEINDYILNSQSISDLLEIKISQILLAITILLTYLTKVHVTRIYITNLLKRFGKNIENLPRRWFLLVHCGITTMFYKILLRFRIMILSTMLGIVTGNLMFIVALTGLVTSTAIGFVFPVLIIIKVSIVKCLTD
ncbi:hypothetical protein MHBO_000745 [Bonamia ostreae]|uniref:Amino acid transporter transmembrane domain-containing protein n=1 Tax=Bonamia ostreae TaxID=126728 RepID=A0ABV2AH77_9EUKA